MTWDELIGRVDLRLPVPATLRADDEAHDLVKVVATLHVPDIHTRESITVNTSALVPRNVDDFVGGEVEAVHMLRRLLKNALMHELDEGFWLDGKHLRDPHNPDGSFR